MHLTKRKLRTEKNRSNQICPLKALDNVRKNLEIWLDFVIQES